MSSNRIETLIDEVQAAFDRPPADIERGLETDEADILQLRKSCRLLAGAETLLEQGFYTLVVEASFVAIERVIEFKLLEGGVDALDILPALKREDSSVGGSATDPRRQLAGSCALLWDFREGVVSPTNRGRPTRIARAVPSA